MISHPAHFHMFRYTIYNLKRSGNEVVVVIRPKDVLEQLLINDGMPFVKVKDRPKKWGMLGLLKKFLRCGKYVERKNLICWSALMVYWQWWAN